jgi:DNA-binding transcriptional ArsR family regulator
VIGVVIVTTLQTYRYSSHTVNLVVDNIAQTSIYSSTSELTMEADVESPARVFAALADPVRLQLVTRLAEGDSTVGELAMPFAITVQAVSKHLKVLEGAGVVRRTGTGHRSPVQLNAEIFTLLDRWIDRYQRQCEERYERLDQVLATVTDSGGGDSMPGHP